MSFIILTYFTFSESGFVSLDLFDLKSADPDHTNADHARLDQDPKTWIGLDWNIYLKQSYRA